ncbi:hypothetical protein [Streptomyces osmaniensis]|uniref:Uncharacterized protein n=1 Tax=Streptomyces osmaniensis TaxID=593134 RepID=A0ABP6YX61_9ACTN|nr:hypothetical protein KJK32_46655 [Streptomyces sp. JCM17656]
MPCFRPTPPLVRIRRLRGDPRLHLTEAGSTDSGYLTEAFADPSWDIPYLHLALEDRPHELFGEANEPDRYGIRADCILLHDVDELAKHVDPLEHRVRELLEVLDGLRRWMAQGEPPPCQHEDVIETPELGSVTVPGICQWCPTPLVKLNDEWIPS